MAISRLFYFYAGVHHGPLRTVWSPQNHTAFNGFMITIEQARKIEPQLKLLPDEAVLELIEDMYGFAELACEKWNTERGSKNP